MCPILSNKQLLDKISGKLLKRIAGVGVGGLCLVIKSRPAMQGRLVPLQGHWFGPWSRFHRLWGQLSPCTTIPEAVCSTACALQ